MDPIHQPLCSAALSTVASWITSYQRLYYSSHGIQISRMPRLYTACPVHRSAAEPNHASYNAETLGSVIAEVCFKGSTLTCQNCVCPPPKFNQRLAVSVWVWSFSDAIGNGHGFYCKHTAVNKRQQQVSSILSQGLMY